MILSDLALKLGTNTRLNPGEIETLRMALNDLDQNRAYIAQLRSGRVSLPVDKLSAVTAEFRFQPINMARMYATSKDVSGYMQFDTAYTEFETNSYFELDPADNTKLLLKLPIAYLDQHRYLLTGASAKSDYTTSHVIEMEFYDADDILVDSQALFATLDAVENFSYTFPSVDTVITDVTYIKFKIAYGASVWVCTEMYIHLVR